MGKKKLLALVLALTMLVSLFMISDVAPSNAAAIPPAGYVIVKIFDDFTVTNFSNRPTDGSSGNYLYWINPIFKLTEEELNGCDAIQFRLQMQISFTGTSNDYINLVTADKEPFACNNPSEFPPRRPSSDVIWTLRTPSDRLFDQVIFINLAALGVTGQALMIEGFATRARDAVVTDLVGLSSDPNATAVQTTSTTSSETEPETVSDTQETTGTSTNIEIIKGDINNDGLVDVEDLLLLKKHVLKIAEFTPNSRELKAADVNDDNIADVEDLLLLKKYILKIKDFYM